MCLPCAPHLNACTCAHVQIMMSYIQVAFIIQAAVLNLRLDQASRHAGRGHAPRGWVCCLTATRWRWSL